MGAQRCPQCALPGQRRFGRVAQPARQPDAGQLRAGGVAVFGAAGARQRHGGFVQFGAGPQQGGGHAVAGQAGGGVQQGVVAVQPQLFVPD